MNSTGALRTNFIRNFRQLGSSPASWAWAVTILGIQLLVTVMGGPDQQPAKGWFETLALSREPFLKGRIWQIFTYGLLHGPWWHVAVNALFVLLVGSRIEHMAGRAVMVKAVVAGVIGGGICHVIL